MNWPWIIATVSAYALAAFVIVKLLRELRVSHHAGRARVADLERERDTLIEKVALARGVDLSSEPTAPLRSHYVDPATGHVYFSDGEVRDSHGVTMIQAGATTVDPEYLASKAG